MARKPNNETSTANLGFEQKLWLAADKLRNNMDAAEPERSGDSQPQAARRASEARQYKHVVLGLIFLSRAERDRSRASVTRRASRGLRVKYISDTFEEHRAKLLAGKGDYAGANPEDPDEPSGARQTAAGSPKGERGGANQYKAENVFWVPADARWSHLQASAKQPTIGKTVDDAMVAIERDNPRLKGVLPKDYGRPGLDKHRLGELIDLIATISLTAASEGEKTHRSVDLLGRVYDWCGATKTAAGSPQGERGGAHQYFLTRFASAEGKNGGPAKCEVRSASVEVKTSRPFVIRNSSFNNSLDPACGSGGSLPASRLCGVRFAEKDRAIAQGVVQSEKFVESHGGKLGDISIYGQDKWARRQRPFDLAKRARRVRLRRQQPKQSNATTRRLAIMNLAIRGDVSLHQSGGPSRG